VGDEPRLPSAEDLQALGVYDPAADDADDRLELIHYALERGATIADVAAATNLGELALDMHLRPRTDTTLGEVVSRAGLEWDWAQRLLGAMGLDPDLSLRLTADEIATLELLASVGSDLLGEDATAQLARVAGAAMSRVAESIVTTFRLQFELPQRAAGTRYVDVVKSYAAIAETMLPAFVTSLDVMLRRQIVAVAERVWSTDEEQSTVTLPRTVGFADLVGFTEATGSLSVRDLAAVLVAFDERATEIVLRGRGQIVKTIGDEVLFVAEDPLDACRIALDLVAEFGTGDLPPVRVGLATGEVVSVFGDVYGPEVNLAARLVRLAEPSTAVVSERAHRACADHFEFEALGPHQLKGFAAPVDVYRLVGRRPA
jgi:adenylate cyclase